jgi:hypothetical protein
MGFWETQMNAGNLPQRHKGYKEDILRRVSTVRKREAGWGTPAVTGGWKLAGKRDYSGRLKVA